MIWVSNELPRPVFVSGSWGEGVVPPYAVAGYGVAVKGQRPWEFFLTDTSNPWGNGVGVVDLSRGRATRPIGDHTITFDPKSP